MHSQTSSAARPFLTAAVLLASILSLPLVAFAKRAVPENLGNGLDKLVESGLAIKAGAPPAEYGNCLTPVTLGHSAAAGADSVPAFAALQSNLPEDFTSPGLVTVYFDANNNRLNPPQVRLKPDIAATDGVNTSFLPQGPIPFGDVPLIGDSNYDADTYPNLSVAAWRKLTSSITKTFV